ncbi:MAG: hypothetical protein WDZ91_01185 [Paenibacillaceae bacterium]
MLKNVKSYLNDFVMVRTDEIGSNVLMKHAEYQELSEELKSKLHEILKYVPEDRRQLVFDYEEKEQAQMALSVEIMYRQGLIDGVYLNRRLSSTIIHE